MENGIASLNVNIDKDMIQKTVERIVIQEISSRLGDPSQYFEKIVKNACTQTVDSSGNPSRSSYDKMPLIEWLANHHMKEVMSEICKDWMLKNRSSFEKIISKQLQKSLAPMATIMAKNAACNIGNPYSLKVVVEEHKQS